METLAGLGVVDMVVGDQDKFHVTGCRQLGQMHLVQGPGSTTTTPLLSGAAIRYDCVPSRLMGPGLGASR